MTRRLAAILVADVVGYSRLMEADEAGTLAALRERRKTILEPVVKEHGGRIVKVMGDGVLVEFASAVNAVKGALKLQERFAAANEPLPEARRIVLRVGINLGDVVGEGSDIYGEGVNIAARLESLAPPGGVLVSASVHEQARNKLDAVFEDAGQQALKNIAEPIRTYRVITGTAQSSISHASAQLPSIAVLPFDNMSGDLEQGYFSDGVTEDIITELSRFRNLFVIARNSSSAFRGQEKDLREVGRKLGARYIVEGSVRKAGRRVRITAQLIDAASGNHLWSERYDRDLDDIFAIQDEVTAAITSKVAGQVQITGIESVRRRAGNFAAYDYYLKGLEHINRAGAEDTLPAVDYLSKAVEEDPNFAQAYALLALAQCNHAMGQFSQEGDFAPEFDKALKSAERAVSLDGNDARCHASLGAVCLSLKRFDRAAYHIGCARALNPNDPDVVVNQCYLEAFGDSPERALELVEFARKLSPAQPNWYFEPWGIALYQLRRYREAAELFERALAKQPYSYRYLAACYAQLGDMAKARAAAAESLRLQPDFSFQKWLRTEPYISEASLLHMAEGLRKAGLPE